VPATRLPTWRAASVRASACQVCVRALVTLITQRFNPCGFTPVHLGSSRYMRTNRTRSTPNQPRSSTAYSPHSVPPTLVTRGFNTRLSGPNHEPSSQNVKLIVVGRARCQGTADHTGSG
jgi:hypothetical protein